MTCIGVSTNMVTDLETHDMESVTFLPRCQYMYFDGEERETCSGCHGAARMSQCQKPRLTYLPLNAGAGRDLYYITRTKGLSSGTYSWSCRDSAMAILKCSGACVWTGVHPKSPLENGLNYIFAYIDEIGAKIFVAVWRLWMSSS